MSRRVTARARVARRQAVNTHDATDMYSIHMYTHMYMLGTILMSSKNSHYEQCASTRSSSLNAALMQFFKHMTKRARVLSMYMY